MSLREKIEDLEFKLENFEMDHTDKQYSERYAEYVDDHETDCDHTISGVRTKPKSFQVWFEEQEKEDDLEFQAILELRDEFLADEEGMI